jgi:hypothetical protein
LCSCVPQNVKLKTYKTLILLIALCNFDVWSLTLKKKHEWACFRTEYEENFWIKQKVTREWKKFN